MTKRKKTSLIRRLFHRLVVVLGAVGLTIAFFLVLPLMQAISKPPKDLWTVRQMDIAAPPPPKTIEEPEPEKPPEKPDPPAEAPKMQLMNLGDISNLIEPGAGTGFGAPMVVNLGQAMKKSGGLKKLASVRDLDQKPRVTFQPMPSLNARLRKKLHSSSASVYVVFIVNERGRVESAAVQSSSDPAFEACAIKAVRQWKFEPGKRGGESVRFRMRVPITFPKE